MLSFPTRFAAALVLAFFIALPASGDICADLSAAPPDSDVAAAVLSDVDNDVDGACACFAGLKRVCAAVANLEAMPSKTGAEQAAVAEAVRGLAPDILGAIDRGRTPEDNLWQEMKDQLPAFSPGATEKSVRSRFTPVGFVFFQGYTTQVNLETDILDPDCVADCGEALRRGAKFVILASLYRRGLGKLLEDERAAALVYLDGLDKRWQAYFQGARSQYPWELFVNSARYKRSAKLVEPPEQQFIFLHPDLAYELAESGTGDDELNEALVLELVGFNRWKFKGNKVRRPWGVSLVATWRSSAEEEVGYGVLFHLPKSWSIGAAYRDQQIGSDVAIVLSADLAKLVTNRRGLFEKVFE